MTRTTAKKTTGNFLNTYKFNWHKGEQDPVIDRIRTCMQDTGYDIRRLSRESGVSYGALSKWDDGTTIRPQYATVCAAIRAMGYDFAVVPANHKMNGHAWNAEMPQLMKGQIVKRFRTADLPPRRHAGVSGAELAATSS